MDCASWETISGSGRRVCVVGLGRSGLAASRLLLHHGAAVRALELSVTSAIRDAWQPLEAQGAELIEGPHPASALEGCVLVVRSPGVPADAPILKAARRRGIPIRSELTLAASRIRTPILAITGTNGKSTTTAWTAHLLRRGAVGAVAAGNIGRPLSQAVLEEGEETIFVAEVSSFQLEDSPGLHPLAACILNLTADHLDRHGSFAAYRAAKWAITRNQEAGDLLVLGPGLEPPEGQSVRARILRCSPEPERAGEGLFVSRGWLCRRTGGEQHRLVRPRELSLPGPHNLLNAMAAVGLASALISDPEPLASGLRDFPGLPHRLEEVGRIGTVRMINDSKSTNVGSLRVALQSFPKPVALIAGGRDKEGPFEDLRELAVSKVRRLVAIGEAAQKIRSAWPAVASETAADLDEAISRALQAGADVVLLSPGCASFDMFRDYEERGDIFRALVARRRGGGCSLAGTGG